MAFLRKNALIGHRSISLQPVCAKITSSRMIAVEHRSVQKLHSPPIALLQIFDLFIASSRVATVIVTSQRTVFIEDILFIRNYVASLRWRHSYG